MQTLTQAKTGPHQPATPASKDDPSTFGHAASAQDAMDTHFVVRIDHVLQVLRSKRIPLSILHAVINLYLNKSRKISLSALAGNLGITTAALTNIADGLEKLGFAKRRTNRVDRRLTWISLTPHGMEFAEWLEGSLKMDCGDFGACMPVAESIPI